MRFTEHEMVFLNSITKGGSVLGIPLHFRSKKDYDSEIKKTIQGLVEKGVLKSETELAKQGALPARALECYKNSRTHIILNYLHIALLEKQDAVIIIPLKNQEYELLRLPRTAVFYLLLEKYPVLRNAGYPAGRTPKLLDMDVFLQELKEQEGNIMVGEFQDGTAVREQVYFWKKENMYHYDLNTRMQREINAARARRELLELLRIREEVESYA